MRREDSSALFRSLQEAPPDKILSLVTLYSEDPRESKIDLGIGMYRDESGKTPILTSVRTAEQRLFHEETTKAYVGSAGDPEFVAVVARLLFGDFSRSDRVDGIQTPGGAGALHVLARLLNHSRQRTTIWLPIPTWTNHLSIFEDVGMTVRSYPYFDPNLGRVDFGQMMETLGKAAPGDAVLLHGCCHNPTGADLAPSEWQELCDLMCARGLLPFVDLAYQGFGDGLDQDAYGVRHFASRAPEMVVAYSCSKNFGIYRERTGAAFVIAETKQRASAARSQMVQKARVAYSMPPDHGGSIVRTILTDPELEKLWRSELTAMKVNITTIRSKLSEAFVGVTGDDRYLGLGSQKGMFSLIGIGAEQAYRLRSEFGIYVVEDGRINVAGLRASQIMPFVKAIADLRAEQV
jgi:aromatic-amino-acid transaminase